MTEDREDNTDNSPPGSAILFGLALGILLFASFRVLSLRRELTFPRLPGGSYVGHFSGLPDGDTTMLVESLDNGRNLRFWFLREGLKEISLSPRQKSADSQFLGGEEGPEVDQFYPLRININHIVYTLSGSRDRASWGGGVIASDGGGGRWFLERIADAPEVVLSLPGVDMREWMFEAALNKLREQELSELSKKGNESQKILRELRQLDGAPGEVDEMANKKLPMLSNELEAVREENETLSKQVYNLQRELDILARLSSQGRVTMVARRIWHREKSFFLATWPKEQTGDGLVEDQAMQDGMQIPEQQYIEAKRRADLMHAIENERTEIRRLERVVEGDFGIKEEPRRPLPKQAEPEEEKSFWNRLFW